MVIEKRLYLLECKMRILSTCKNYVRPPMEQPFNDIRARKLGMKMQQKENWKKKSADKKLDKIPPKERHLKNFTRDMEGM